MLQRAVCPGEASGRTPTRPDRLAHALPVRVHEVDSLVDCGGIVSAVDRRIRIENRRGSDSRTPGTGDHHGNCELLRWNADGISRSELAAAVIAAARLPTSTLPSYRAPLMKKVGVPFTPLRMPLKKSSRTRAAWTPASSSAAKRSR